MLEEEEYSICTYISNKIMMLIKLFMLWIIGIPFSMKGLKFDKRVNIKVFLLITNSYKWKETSMNETV